MANIISSNSFCSSDTTFEASLVDDEEEAATDFPVSRVVFFAGASLGGVAEVGESLETGIIISGRLIEYLDGSMGL